jgi:hypothetical protein
MNEDLKLLNFSGDARKLRAELKRRLKNVDRSLNDLCRSTAVNISTVWRWGKGSKPNVSTINKLEIQLMKWEKVKLAAFM